MYIYIYIYIHVYICIYMCICIYSSPTRLRARRLAQHGAVGDSQESHLGSALQFCSTPYIILYHIILY